ncbi:MAG: IacB protein [Methylocystaceae bacterium]|nr:IacB protein [Methylocystaceae bacterium]
MSEKLRVLFCISVKQNFMDATQEEQLAVWGAFSSMMNGMNTMDGMEMLGMLDDDRSMVGSSVGYPFTAYFMADCDDYDTVVKACDLFRTTPVGDGVYKLWKYCGVETRIGRALQPPAQD